MKETIILFVFIVIGIYLSLGLLFSIFFVSKGVNKLDEGAHGAGIGFRLVIIPGCMVFWPLLLKRWINHRRVEDSGNGLV
jgi:hypothetical protein